MAACTTLLLNEVQQQQQNFTNISRKWKNRAKGVLSQKLANSPDL